MEKNKKTNSSLYIYIIFAIGLLLIASIIANIFFFYRSQSRIFDCSLGESIELEFMEESNMLLANIVYPSNIVSGTKYNQTVTLKTNDLKANYYVRAKALYADYNIVNESQSVEISPFSNWLKGENNYYYLTTQISSYMEIDFIDSLTLPIIYSQVRNNTIITIVFEFINTSYDVETLWNINPSIFNT